MGMDNTINVLLLDRTAYAAAQTINTLNYYTRLLAITAVFSSEAFDQALKQKRVHIIITAVHLEWQDVRHVLHQVRQAWPQCYVILYTAERDARQIAACFKLGADDYVTKADGPSLIKIVQQAIYQHQRVTRPTATERRKNLLEVLGELSQQFYDTVASGSLSTLLSSLCPTFDVSRVRILENQLTPDAMLEAHTYYGWMVARKRHDPLDEPVPFEYEAEGLTRWVDRLSQGEALTSAVNTLPTAEADFIDRTLPGAQLIALIPIFSGGRWWGILELTEERPNYIWSQGEVEALLSIASVLGAAVEIQRLVHAEQAQRLKAERLTHTLQRQANELQELFDMSLSLAETFDPAVMMERLYTHIRRLFAPDIFIAVLCHDLLEEKGQIEIALAFENDQPMSSIHPGLCLPVQEAGVTGWIVRHGETVFLADMTADSPPPVPLRRVSQQMPRTWLGTPLLAGQRVVGAISVQSAQPYAFSENDRRIIETLAAFVALAVENAYLFQQETRRRLGAEALVNLATTVIHDNEQSEILDNILAAVVSFLPDISNCRISMFNEEMTHVTFLHSWAKDVDLGRHLYESFLRDGQLPLEHATLTRRTLAANEPITIYDMREEDGLSSVTGRAVDEGLRSVLYVPMRVHGRVVGMLHINVYNSLRHFTQKEIDLCQSVANYGAVALQNARLRRDEQEQMNLVNTLREVGSLLTSEHTLDEVYERLFDLLATVIAYDMVTIQLYDAERQTMSLAAKRGFAPDVDVVGIVDNLGIDYIASIVSNGEPYRVIADTAVSKEWVTIPGFSEIRSSINCLLRVKDRLIGILNVDHKQPHAYSDDKARTVLAFANQAAIALENARLYDELQARVQELSLINQVTMIGTTALYLDDLLAQTTAVLAGQRYPHYIGFYLLDEVGRYYIPHPSFHTAAGLPAPQRIPVNAPAHPLATIGHGRDIRQHQPAPSLQSFLRTQVTQPLLVNDATVGLMTVGFVDEAETLDEDDLYFLQTIAGQLSTAVQRASLYEDAQFYAAQLTDKVSQRTAQLQTEKERTQTILDTAGEGIFFINTAGKILYANEAVAAQSGYLVNEVIGQTIFSFYAHPDQTDAQDILSHMRHHISQNQEWRGEIECVQRDGTPYTVSVNLTPIANSSGQQDGFVIVQADITYLKEIERLKSEFVSNVSHELRTPLTNIKTYLTLLRRGKQEKAARYLDVLDHETERLARLIQDLLNLSRLDTESTVMKLEPLSITAVVEQIWPELTKRAADKTHTLQWHAPDKPLYALADVEHLPQTVLRLVVNAIAYTPPGGRITLTAGLKQDNAGMIYLSISDTGPGLTAEDLEHLFERFFRGTAAQDTREPGTGLGLAISQEIINRHNGRIDATNNPERGATFTIWLPRARQ